MALSFKLNNMSPTKWGLLRSLFLHDQKNVPYKSPLGFYKIQKFYKKITYKSMCPRRVWECISLIENPLEKALKHSLLVVEILTPIKNKRRSIPVLPHKAVAEVSKIKHYRRGELLWCTDGRVKPLMDRKVVGIVFFGVAAMVSMVTSPTTAGCSVV